MPPLNKTKNKLLKAYMAKKEKHNHPTTTLNDPIFSSKGAKTKQELIDKIDSLPEDQIFKCSKLLDTMVYPDGNYKGEILSPYLQKKAIDFIISTQGKSESNALEMKNKINLLKKENGKLTKQIESITSKHKSLAIKVKKQEKNKDRYISQIRSIISKKISKKTIQKSIIKKVKENKHTYTPEFIALITKISNTGQISLFSAIQCTKELYIFLTDHSPNTWISASILSRWNKEIAELKVIENIPNLASSQFASYGIMADESTRGEKKIFLTCISYWDEKKQQPMLTILSMKDLNNCSASTISSSVGETINKYLLNPNKCQYWLTDNTSYMSGSKGEL